MEKCIVHLRDNMQSMVGRRERKWFFLETCRVLYSSGLGCGPLQGGVILRELQP